MAPRLRRLLAEEVAGIAPRGLDAETMARAAQIVEEIRTEGEPALVRWAQELGDLKPGGALIIDKAGLAEALAQLAPSAREVLERGAQRVRCFAAAQRQALGTLEVAIPGGAAGHEILAVKAAGCYAPGGRFPLPSTVLMTAVTARVAGVEAVWVASPRPTIETLAAAAIAEADGVLAVGGAQAVAALAFGVGGVPACDVVVGPGNRWVTAAKQRLVGRIGIDMLAGPTELLVLADESADPALIAADLLAQAEHDVDAMPVLVTTSAPLVEAVEEQLALQLVKLGTRETAEVALASGFAVVVASVDEAIAVADSLAPEHLQIAMREAAGVAARSSHAGALFIGEGSAEVLGDYCAGPNHTLPTLGGARQRGGLSVFDFLRIRTWLRIDDRGAAAELYTDAAAMAAMEGLDGHRAAAQRRVVKRTP